VVELFFLIIFIITLTTFNIQYSLFIFFLLLFSRFKKNISNNELNYVIIFFIGLPSGFIGQNPLNLNLYIIIIIILSLIQGPNKNDSITLNLRYRYYFFTLFSLTLLIYLPIIFSTYLGINIFDSNEVKLLSNNRPSHMFGFAAPLLLIGFLVNSIVSFFTITTNFDKLFKILSSITFLVILLSIIRYASNINLIPQDYADIRYDGNRFTGITNPDSLGFARSLLFPLAISSSFYFSDLKNKKKLLIFLLIIFSLYATLSRTVLISTSIILIVAFLYQYKKKYIYFYAIFLVAFFALFLISGFGSALLQRNSINGELNVSGRDSMWITALYVLTISPFVGLRPGGWQIWLDNGVEWLPGSNVVVQSTHSFYLETAVTWGIPVTLFIVLFFLYSIITMHRFIRLYLKHKKINYSLLNWAIGIQCICIGLLFHGITENIHIYQWFTVISFSIAVKHILKKASYENISCS
jgi:hypothetical protein